MPQPEQKRASESVSGEVATGSPVPADLLQELRADVCRCGAAKRSKMSLCGFCYRGLPPNLQKGLYKRFGRGYENAYAAAAAYLDANVRGRALS